jgi:carbon starvation protein
MAEATIVQILSAVAQISLAFVLIYLGLSLVRMGYENVQNIREGDGTGAFSLSDD